MQLLIRGTCNIALGFSLTAAGIPVPEMSWITLLAVFAMFRAKWILLFELVGLAAAVVLIPSIPCYALG